MNARDCRTVFIVSLDDARIDYAIGARQTVTVNKPYIDRYWLYGEQGLEYDSAALTDIWRRINRGTFVYDPNNEYVKRILGV